ncbi:uncharacterized protein L199_005142 [Kwoniella botswanensis]|uniref:uncharacterized protein n=1 Tax=Kwoniella botswanensis TaxID=1268659 RepID=UPI00315C5535
MSLNSVVNNLVRAAAGISSTISDTDLDAHVAKLLAEEAKARELKWSELGLTGLLGNSLDRNGSPDPSLPKTNKRFLASVIRTVDGHNSALLKAQAQSARDARGESSRSASGSGKGIGGSRMFGGALRDMSRNGNGNGKGKEREREDRHVRRGDDRPSRDARDDRSLNRYDEDGHARRSTRQSEDDERRYRRYEDERDRNRRRDRSRDRHRDRSSDRSTERDRDRDRSKDEKRSRHHRSEDELTEQQSRRKDRQANTDISDKSNRQSRLALRADKPQDPAKAPSPSRSPSPDPPAAPISKMDKYFNSTYDPRLDFAPIPKEGMIADVGWDNMLAVLKEKGRKKRHQSPTLSDTISEPPLGVLPSRRLSPDRDRFDDLSRKLEKKDKKKRKEERKRRRGSSYDSSEDEREKRKERKRKEKQKLKEKEREDEEKYGGLRKEGGVGVSKSGILEGYEYVKKGGTREWDVGKE